ncbi:hypothetical protein BGY98DRAFT_965617 [Russula aff. rugulosa BPL654]|nr:hypothetical protein BGY98DRAFT_965617 [Russula aff. rugulosa BPL654]
MAETESGAALTIESAIMLRFPPFPAVPDGVELIPFHSFRRSGIRVPIDDDDDEYDGRQMSELIELDGLGIPTIPLRVKHATDNLEKKKKRKKKGGAGSQQVQVAPEKPETWWELWEELEDTRKTHYDPNVAPIDRLSLAGEDFKSGRKWPTTTQGVQQVWDIFRIYIGLLKQNSAPPAPKDLIPEAEPEAKSDDSDSDSDGEELASTHDDAARMEDFLSDPELSMRVFFSSHFRERGLIWSEPRCIATPILVSFFLRYLIRNRVFPEPEFERPIKHALEIVELARVELPNSWKMGRALPDTFSDGCKGLWGSMQLMWLLPEDASPVSPKEPEAKRQKLDHSEDTEQQSPEKPSVAEVDADADVTTAGTKTASVEGGWGTAAVGEDAEGWGATQESWGDTVTSAPATAEGDEGATHELNPPIWDASTVEIQATWDLQPPTLLPIMGPTALPMTHTTGVVEQSTRRIVRIDPPRQPPAEAVEENLGCRFARLILAPWEKLDKRTYESGTDVLPPTILSTSRGAVVLEEEEGEGGDGKSVPKAHRPWKDEVAVLVDPTLTDVMLVGMGIGAIWVEIVRDKEAEGSSAGASKKGKGKKKEVPKYWYMEQLVHQLPSFYIDKPDED